MGRRAGSRGSDVDGEPDVVICDRPLKGAAAPEHAGQSKFVVQRGICYAEYGEQ